MTGEDLKRRQARRNRWTVLLLALVALGFYAGFFWKMDHSKPPGGAPNTATAAVDDK